tara:strand:- start:1151 stop:2344 length:1194 start_codon:yes stop_codon:yes gene_type:complete
MGCTVMKFSKLNLDNLEPKKSKYLVMDDALEFFGLRTYPTGKKMFVVRLRQNGKPKLYTVAPFPAVSIIQAHKLAAPIIEKYQQGVDVKQVEAIERTRDKMLRSCIDDYLPTVKPTTQKDISRCMTAGWLGWLDTPIKELTQSKVLKVYDQRAKVARNRARLEMAYLRSIWNFHKKALNLPDSPTTILNEDRKGWNKINTRTRRLDFETASKWYKAMDAINPRDRNLFLLIYYTGLRSIEAKNLKWSEIELDNASLHLKDTKNGQPLNIPLSTQALEVLNNIHHDSEYVFSQVSRSGVIGPMTSYSKSFSIIKDQGVSWSVHDARRGFIVAGGVLGLNSYMIKQLVNHSDNSDVHASYQTYTVAELRSTAQRICNHLENHLIAGDNVVELKAQQGKL